MGNMDIQNYDLGSVVIKNPEYETGLLQFPGADTYVEGTILARKEVATAVTVTPDGGNTGDGTVAAVVDNQTGIPKVGDYNVECVVAVTNGGIFKIEDPNGQLIASDIEIPAGAGNSVDFAIDGITFTITDGATDFAAGDKFAATVVADGDWVIYDADGVAGAQIPKGILTVEEVATGAADVATRVLIKGTVRADRLVIDAGGSITDAVKDMLRDYSIIALDATDLSLQDNQ